MIASIFLSAVTCCCYLIFPWVLVIWSWLQLFLVTFYEMSGTVAQNVNTFILLYFSQEDLVFKQAIEKEQNLVRNWYKLSLKSLILSPGQFCSAFITKGIIPEVSWFQIELFSWPHSIWLIMSRTFFFLALWEHQNFCLRFLFLKYFYIICDRYWYDVCVINLLQLVRTEVLPILLTFLIDYV